MKADTQQFLPQRVIHPSPRTLPQLVVYFQVSAQDATQLPQPHIQPGHQQAQFTEVPVPSTSLSDAISTALSDVNYVVQADNTNIFSTTPPDLSSFLGPSATQTSSTSEQDSAQQHQQPRPQQKELPEIYRPHFTPIEYHLSKPVKVKCNHCPKEVSW